MWSLKYSVYDKKGIYAEAVRIANVSVEGFPLNYYQDKKNYYFIATGFVQGNENQIKNFYSILKKNPSIIKLEKSKQFFLSITKLEKEKESERFVHLFYDPRLIHSKPTKINANGWEENEVICFERKILEKIILVAKKKYKFKLKSFKKDKFKGLSIIRGVPSLPKKQLEAIRLAIKEKYYDYPRKINLEKLSKILKINKSTYRENLRKAEKKIMPETI